MGIDARCLRRSRSRLDRARQLVTAKGWIPRIEKALAPGLWATNIRENTARPSDIGSHAFGWAVDIAACFNPDIRPFPEVFAEVTSTDAGGRARRDGPPASRHWHGGRRSSTSQEDSIWVVTMAGRRAAPRPT